MNSYANLIEIGEYDTFVINCKTDLTLHAKSVPGGTADA